MADLVLRAIKAKHGDCLLLLAEGATILIDGGPSGVYRRFLADELKALPREGDEPPVIDLLMVSHIDADHIDGILDLTEEMIEDDEEERDPIVNIREAWHNSFADAIGDAGKKNAGTTEDNAAKAASIMGTLPFGGGQPDDSQLVLSSVGQGRRLRLDLKRLNIHLNRHFNKGLALLGATDTPWEKGALSLEVIGPAQEQVDKLRKEWAKQLEKILAKEADAETAAKSMDTSVSNLASIVVLGKVGDRRILLTGDARGDMILGWLEEAGHLKPGETIHFDIVKLPHHGSDRNLTPDFFKRITADHYVVSGDGKHGNPEPNTFKMLFEARPDLDYTIHMTYSPDEIKDHREFIKHELGSRLDEVLAPPGREDILKYPGAGETFVDIAV